MREGGGRKCTSRVVLLKGLVILIACLTVTAAYAVTTNMASNVLPDPAALQPLALDPQNGQDWRQSSSNQLPQLSIIDTEVRLLAVRTDAALIALAQDHGAGQGTQSDPVVLDGASLQETGLTRLLLEGTRLHLVIQDLELESTGTGHGVTLQKTENVTLRNVALMGHHTGIRDVGSSNLVVEASDFTGNEMAIRLDGSQSVTIDGNRFKDNRYAVLTQTMTPDDEQVAERPSMDVTIMDNSIDGDFTALVDADPRPHVLLTGSGHRITGNEFTGGPSTGIRLQGATDTTIDSNVFSYQNSHGAILVGTNNVQLNDNLFHRNLKSALFSFQSTNLQITENDFTQNPNGAIKSSEDVGLLVEGNRFSWSATAIGLWSATDATITKNTIHGGTHGVRLSDGENVEIQGNTLTSIFDQGVLIRSSTDVLVTDNEVSDGKKRGIHLSATGKSRVEQNMIQDTSQAITVSGGSSDVSVTENEVKGKGWVGLHVVESDQIKLKDNLVSGQDFGVFLGTGTSAVHTSGGILRDNYAGVTISNSTTRVHVEGVSMEENIIAAMVDDGADHLFSDNDITGNNIGVFLRFAESTTVTRNLIEDNRLGFYLVRSTQNLVYDNIISTPETNQNALLINSPGNEWNRERTPGPNIMGGPWIGGNWWHDYIGEDLNGDGLGNVPHQPIPYHPLLEPVAYEFGLPMGPFDLLPLTDYEP